ncbi:MAG: hypothetical protein QOD55_2025 [Solirubrobacteraceae bacterium]|nr:hypothetical protein [Solirubrobacteraceae bacterium]
MAAILLAVALGAWIVTAARMDGMDAGPGTGLGTLPWFAGAWLTMMAAMMLPSAAPAVRLFARTAGNRAAAPFVAGYLAVWIAFGLAAYGAYRIVAAADPAWLQWDRGGPYLAGGAVAAAGLYQLTPLKAACLRHCRSPLHFLLARWRPGARGSFLMGAEHGAWCAGCCWGLMLTLFAVGVMNVLWMLVVAALVAAEKVLPRGDRVSPAIAVGLVALGVWIAVAPGSVPLLTEPAGSVPMDAMPMPMPTTR